MKKILHYILKIIARAIIQKYQPKVIGVTGSVGKTSAKEAIFSVLDNDFKVRRSRKNYNNEIGTPLTIFGYKNSPGKNILEWLWVFWFGFRLLIINEKEYPDVLILEMGADKRGDIYYLSNIAPPFISVITAIGPSHLEYFGTIENIIKEKSEIVKNLKSNGWAVLNNDDRALTEVIANTNHKKITFGQSEKSNVKLSSIKISFKDGEYGTAFKLSHKGAEVPMFLPNVLGWQHAQSAAIACAVGLAMSMNLVDIAQKLLDYKPARGRTRLVKGVKNSLIIDDTYNASPQSSKVALDILINIPVEGRKIAVFGDMLELGSLTESGHKEVGRDLVNMGVDYLFVIGERSRHIAHGAKESGMSEDKIFHFPKTMEAGIFLQERIKENDVILIKGSRGAKMEQVVYEIMAKPWLAGELLVGPVIK
ncbi:UDP-N-acetylmuramoyl-tripeptide--D-alanyl-D-alanine ligase [Candidatus Parcubacteria bacterium]|jgi:UDP-N-acetylmuramoyl-tripeptide--D-alanyl-D-alanine ligase|nr:UDP-N-acetylmuramoyl-tripeptide--D-alanyl-D-alanine ligase [Candidatus Parcubacteria bacterium]MBT7228981.1 UDP-N-acetylmuramoyl-tripeptide--D-alanyl-D-alanine ligase [Candidatus Parcubacteria bacterium]